MEQSGGFYETEENILIPECMLEGSLKDTVSMMSMDNPTYHYLMSKHECDVQQHSSMSGHFRWRKGGVIVDKACGIVYDNPFDPNSTNDNEV